VNKFDGPQDWLVAHNMLLAAHGIFRLSKSMTLTVADSGFMKIWDINFLFPPQQGRLAMIINKCGTTLFREFLLSLKPSRFLTRRFKLADRTVCKCEVAFSAFLLRHLKGAGSDILNSGSVHIRVSPNALDFKINR